MHHPLEVVAIDPIESQRHQCGPDGTDGPFGKGDMVRNAAHEREGLPVQVHDGYVCRAHDAFTLSSRCPMQHRSTGEVSASMDQRHTFQQSCQNLMQRSGCLTQLASLAWRWTGIPPNARLQSTSVV